MDDATFLERLATLKAMPDFISDVRDFQVVKNHPYPSELKKQAFDALYNEASEEQRRRLPYLFLSGDILAQYAVDVLCELFLKSSYQQQQELINSPGALAVGSSTIQSYASSIKSRSDVDQLRKGLAAAVLLDNRDDYRDVNTSLASLWLAAARVGIDPLPYFQAAAQIASTEDPYGIGSPRHTLANFHTFAIFKEQVEPNLP